MAAWRLTLPNIMKAKKKLLEVLAADTLGVDIRPRLATLPVSEPPVRSNGIKVSDVVALIDELRNEAKGI